MLVSHFFWGLLDTDQDSLSLCSDHVLLLLFSTISIDCHTCSVDLSAQILPASLFGPFIHSLNHLFSQTRTPANREILSRPLLSSPQDTHFTRET